MFVTDSQGVEDDLYGYTTGRVGTQKLSEHLTHPIPAVLLTCLLWLSIACRGSGIVKQCVV
jgi:hypothetical protein